MSSVVSRCNLSDAFGISLTSHPGVNSFGLYAQTLLFIVVLCGCGVAFLFFPLQAVGLFLSVFYTDIY